MARKSTINLEQEAQKFTAKKHKLTAPKKEKPITVKDHYVAAAMSALMILGNGRASKEAVKEEALAWAEFMLEDD